LDRQIEVNAILFTTAAERAADVGKGAVVDTNQDAYQKLWSLIKHCRFAMMVTMEGDGALRSRPMSTVNKEFAGALWFFTPADSAAVAAIASHPDVCLAYADSKDADFVSVSGNGSIESDANLKQELWNPMVQAWFPQGPQSSDVVLIRVDANHAEYWDSTSNKLVQLYSLASALMQGSAPKHMGTHRSLTL